MVYFLSQTLNAVPIYICICVLFFLLILGLFFLRISSSFFLTFKEKRNMVLQRKNKINCEDSNSGNFVIPKKITYMLVSYIGVFLSSIITIVWLLANINATAKEIILQNEDDHKEFQMNIEINDAFHQGIDECLYQKLGGVRLADYTDNLVWEVRKTYTTRGGGESSEKQTNGYSKN